MISVDALYQYLHSLTATQRSKMSLTVNDINGKGWAVSEIWHTLSEDALYLELMRDRKLRP